MSDSKPQQIQDIFSIYAKQVENIKPQQENDYEFEIRFIESKIDKLVHERIFKTLNTYGFRISKTEYLLRISPQVQGEKKLRIELDDITKIQEYCLSEQYPKTGKCVIKKSVLQDNKPIYNNEYLFRTSIQKEEYIHDQNPLVKQLKDKWSNLKKYFRYLYRTTLVHPDYPHIKIDMSIVRSSKESNTHFARSNVLNEDEKYEVEIECVDLHRGNIKQAKNVISHIKKTIKYILGGIQNTAFPVPFHKLEKVLGDYNQLCRLINNVRDKNIRIRPFFMGPSSITLQKENFIKNSENNIETGFCVTDKADGDRKLLFINKDNEAYFIDSNLQISFTGIVFDKRELNVSHTIIDGEHITKDKYNNSVSIFAAFDIYCYQQNDVRNLPFIEDRKDEQSSNRYDILQKCVSQLCDDKFTQFKSTGNRLTIQYKNFENRETFYQSCDTIFNMLKNYNYNTDGLIITSKYQGVPKGTRKITWKKSFKWKPAEFNTIDFLIKVKKDATGEKIVHTKYHMGMVVEYYEIELYTGYNDSSHMTLQEKLLQDKWQRYHHKNDSYYPKKFEPTNPSEKEAYLCHIHLFKDRNNNKVMYSEEKDIIEDDTVVEFRYERNDDDKYENWIPLRMRYDKTSAYKKNKSNYGNDFKTANKNWQSIHDPITEKMMRGIEKITILQKDEDDDLYYNNGQGKSDTHALRKFHNLYVKSKLIEAVSKKGNNLIDLAVGKGGDLSKWIHNRLNGVLGIDISKDNINNPTNGACARYIQELDRNKNIPICMFVQGDSRKPIDSGEFADGLDERSHMIVKALMGESSMDRKDHSEAFLRTHAGIFINKFDICSIQFAIHYMFENKQTLHNFLYNVSKYTKVGGYFIGTCYDGKRVFDYLKKINKDESRSLKKNEQIIWTIKKKYNQRTFPDDSKCLNMKISVYQESINKEFDEYLVNFKYLTKLMQDYGFTIAENLSLPSSGTFESLYENMMKDENKLYHIAKQMSEEEKEISFLNKYFIFKKTQEIVRPLYNQRDFEEIDMSIGVPTKIKNRTIILKT